MSEENKEKAREDLVEKIKKTFGILTTPINITSLSLLLKAEDTRICNNHLYEILRDLIDEGVIFKSRDRFGDTVYGRHAIVSSQKQRELDPETQGKIEDVVGNLSKEQNENAATLIELVKLQARLFALETVMSLLGDDGEKDVLERLRRLENFQEKALLSLARMESVSKRKPFTLENYEAWLKSNPDLSMDEKRVASRLEMAMQKNLVEHEKRFHME